MSKKYRLKKDLPDSKAGDEYVLFRDGIEGPSLYYKNGDRNESYWLQANVENSPDWFEEIKEPERIEVHIVGGEVAGDMIMVRPLNGNHSIKREKFPAIKQAIEAVLNNDCFIIPKGHYMEDYLKSFYTQSDIDKAREDAFNASREYTYYDHAHYPQGTNPIAVPSPHRLYPTFESYLNSLKK